MPNTKGFVRFMEAPRKELLLDAGHNLTNGIDDIVAICRHEWSMLPASEKQKYFVEANLPNKQILANNNECESTTRQQDNTPTAQGTSDDTQTRGRSRQRVKERREREMRRRRRRNQSDNCAARAMVYSNK